MPGIEDQTKYLWAIDTVFRLVEHLVPPEALAYHFRAAYDAPIYEAAKECMNEYDWAFVEDSDTGNEVVRRMLEKALLFSDSTSSGQVHVCCCSWPRLGEIYFLSSTPHVLWSVAECCQRRPAANATPLVTGATEASRAALQRGCLSAVVGLLAVLV